MPRLLPLALAVLLATGCANQSRPPATASSPRAAQSAARTAPRHAAPEELAALSADALVAFKRGDFEQLEKIAAGLRAGKVRDHAGDWALAGFFELFSPVSLQLPRPEAKSLFDAWEHAFPRSPTWATATSIFWQRQSRMDDYASSKPEDRRAWIDASQHALDASIPDAACPHLARQHLRRLSPREGSRAAANRILAEASAGFPAYAPLLEAYADWLRRFAEPEIGPWLGSIADQIGGEDGDELYATVAMSNPGSADDWITRRNLDWPRIRRGLESLHTRWPGAGDAIDRLAIAADSHGDLAALREALLRVESAPHRSAWSDNQGFYLRARRRAGLEPASDLRPALTLDLKLRGYRVAISPDGQTVVVGCAKGEILAFATADLKPLWQLKCPRWVSSLAFSPDGRRLAATGGNHYSSPGGGVWIWDAGTRALLASDDTLPQRLVSCGFTPDGRTLWAAGGVGKQGILLKWSEASGQFARIAAPQLPPGAIKAISVASDAVYFQSERNLWRLAFDASATPPRLLTKGMAYNALALSQDEKQLVAGGWNKNAEWDKPAAIRLVDPAASGEETAPDFAPGRAVEGVRVESLALSRDGRLLAAASSAADFTLWRLPRKSPWLHAYVDDAWTIDDLALSPDASLIATVDTSGHLRLWKVPPAPLRPANGRAWPVK